MEKKYPSRFYQLFEEPYSEQLKEFKEYMKEEKSDENILFYEKVTDLKQLNDVNQIQKIARSIFTLFIIKESKLAINISYQAYKSISRSIEDNKITSEMFDDALNEVSYNIQEVYRRFRLAKEQQNSFHSL